MILLRVVARLRAHNWTAIGLELFIVIAGVFIGTQVSNWNEQRLEKRETERMLTQLQPELQAMLEFLEGARAYYATTRSYADIALLGFEGRRDVSDEQFVISAYQASQVVGRGTNAESWTPIVGADKLRNIEDAGLRRAVSNLMTGNFAAVDFPAVKTKYREDVRRVIPNAVQVAIRKQCGDGPDPRNHRIYALPKTCALKLPDDVAAKSAAALRRQPHLAGELHWHLAAVSKFLNNAQSLEGLAKDLAKRIKRNPILACASIHLPAAVNGPFGSVGQVCSQHIAPGPW